MAMNKDNAKCLDLLLQEYVNKILQLLTDYLKSKQVGELPIDNDFITDVIKIVWKLEKIQTNDELVKRIDSDLMMNLAETILKLNHKIMAWYTINKTNAIKVEIDESSVQENPEERKDPLALEKQEFSLLPLLTQLIR